MKPKAHIKELDTLVPGHARTDATRRPSKAVASPVPHGLSPKCFTIGFDPDMLLVPDANYEVSNNQTIEKVEERNADQGTCA